MKCGSGVCMGSNEIIQEFADYELGRGCHKAECDAAEVLPSRARMLNPTKPETNDLQPL